MSSPTYIILLAGGAYGHLYGPLSGAVIGENHTAVEYVGPVYAQTTNEPVTLGVDLSLTFMPAEGNATFSAAPTTPPTRHGAISDAWTSGKLE